MSNRIKHIFVFIFVFSVFSLTLQASIINFCKESKVFKSQSQSNPLTEEEEESHDSDEDVDEIIYIAHYSEFVISDVNNKISWINTEKNYSSFTKSIPIPPPKA